MSLADNIFIDMCKDILANGCDTKGQKVRPKWEDGKLIIMADTAMAELKKAEKTFMEEETRKLEKKYQQEKKRLHAQFVAEQEAGYGIWADKA